MELPTILDMLTLATSAGMALEQAIEEVARHSEGVVARELRLRLRELALGQRRTLHDALRRWRGGWHARSWSTCSAAWRRRIAGLTARPSTRRTGTSAARAAAAPHRRGGGKATVRMLLPVALLILPLCFVVVLVPAAAELTRLGT